MLNFYLSAIQNALPSPANVKTWSKHSLAQCSLCNNNCCTMLHVFNCCQCSLRTRRYNWRHGMVLHKIMHQLAPAIIKARTPTEEDGDKESVTGIVFRTDSGNKYNNVACLGIGKQEIIRDCENWLVVWDEDKCPAMFPPEIVTISRRPDITIYSPSEKQGIIIELTVPAEENLPQASFRKKNWSMKIWSRRTKCRMGAEIFLCRGRIKRIHE